MNYAPPITPEELLAPDHEIVVEEYSPDARPFTPTHLDPLPPPTPDVLPLIVPPPPPTLLGATTVPAPPTPEEQIQAHVTAAVGDTLHKLDLRAHLEMVARTEPKTFRLWVEMCLPKTPRSGPQQANIINVHNALPKSPLDALPPGFDAHR